MGISLISPNGAAFIKDFPAAHAVNADRIDAYANACLTSDALKSYTPSLSAVTTAPTLGTGGFIRGFYYEIFDQIYTWGEFRFGTAAINAGSGIYTVTLPFAAKSVVGVSTILGGAPMLGNGALWDDSSAAGRLPITTHLRTSTLMMFGVKFNSGLGAREVANSGIITWAINDGMSWNARYQRAP